METQGANASPQPAFRRRIIIIKRSLQMKYVLLVFLSVLVSVVVVSVDFYYVVGKLLVNRLGDGEMDLLARSALGLLTLHFSLYGIVVILVSVFVSHKLAGPIFRLEQVAETVAQGDLSVRVHFRDGDELSETAVHVNRMIESLREKTARDRRGALGIAARLDEIAAAFKSGALAPPEAAARLSALSEEARGIASEFKL
jgi:methyl-accepting chemotaxis protein